MVYLVEKGVENSLVIDIVNRMSDMTGVIPIVTDFEYYSKRIIKATALERIRRNNFSSTGVDSFKYECSRHNIEVLKHKCIGDDLIKFGSKEDNVELKNILSLLGPERVVSSIFNRDCMSSYFRGVKEQIYVVINTTEDLVKYFLADCSHTAKMISNSKEEKLFGLENISIAGLNLNQIIEKFVEKDSVLTKDALILALEKAEKTKKFITFETEKFDELVKESEALKESGSAEAGQESISNEAIPEAIEFDFVL
jgi:hypothetical protein